MYIHSNQDLLSRLVSLVEEACADPCAAPLCTEVRRSVEKALASRGPSASQAFRSTYSTLSLASEVLAERGCLDAAELLEEAAYIAALLSRARSS